MLSQFIEKNAIVILKHHAAREYEEIYRIWTKNKLDITELHEADEINITKPAYTEIATIIANSCDLTDRQFEALEILNIITRYNKDAKDACLIMAKIHLKNNRYKDAIQCCRHLIGDKEYKHRGIRLVSQIRYNEGLYEKAIRWGRTLYKLNRNTDNLLHLVFMLRENGEYEECDRLLNDATNVDRNNLAISLELVELYCIRREYGRALSLAEALRESNSRDERLLRALGVINASVGNFSSAVMCYESAINASNEVNTIAKLMRYRGECLKYEDRGEVRKMEAILEEQRVDKESRIDLLFALSKAYDDFKLFDKSFKFLMQANEEKRSTFKYNFSHDIEEHKELLKISEIFAKHRSRAASDSGSKEEMEIAFIVGMPRSGTTLAERILSNGKNKVTFGESTALPKVIKRFIFSQRKVDLNDSSLRDAMIKKYKELNYIEDETKIYIDKNPYNYKYIAIINWLFPRAKVINCKRNPLDNTLSLFRSYFPEGNQYTFSLDDIVRYYTLYVEYVGQLESLVNNINIFEYDEVVKKPKQRIKELIEEIGWEWDQQYLDIESNKTAIRTASIYQARQKIYSSSSAKWRRYEKHLSRVAGEFERLGLLG